MNKKFGFRTIIYIAVSIVTLSAIALPCHFFGWEASFNNLADINYFDLLSGQIANTLIVLSLTSVLSTNFGQAYWVDVKDIKLVEPFWGCFIGITVYLLSGLGYSVASYAVGFQSGIIVSAAGAVILLVILTFKMISIYFGKEQLKKQLRMEYRKMLILHQSPYVSDYLRRLEQFLEYAKGEEFPQKRRFIGCIKKEVKEIKDGLNSEDKEKVDQCHRQHIDKHMKGMETLQGIDLKMKEYTQNAIKDNESEVIRENIRLLVESENYDTFFELVEELFDWDEKYVCRILRDISRKSMTWMIKDRMVFFKEYALQKLISESGKLEALQNLLMIYDTSNLGMSKLAPEIRMIKDHYYELIEMGVRLDCELSAAEDMAECMKRQRGERKKVKEEKVQLKEQLAELLVSASAKDLRTFYVPIREAFLAYEAGKYETANKYAAIILTDFELDISMIRYEFEISDIDCDSEITFSYVTDDEMMMINKLIEKDRQIMVIPESVKTRLSKLDKVTIAIHGKAGVKSSD